MRDFKVGDRVRISKTLEKASSYSVSDAMLKFSNMCGTIGYCWGDFQEVSIDDAADTYGYMWHNSLLTKLNNWERIEI